MQHALDVSALHIARFVFEAVDLLHQRRLRVPRRLELELQVLDFAFSVFLRLLQAADRLAQLRVAVVCTSDLLLCCGCELESHSSRTARHCSVGRGYVCMLCANKSTRTCIAFGSAPCWSCSLSSRCCVRTDACSTLALLERCSCRLSSCRKLSRCPISWRPAVAMTRVCRSRRVRCRSVQTQMRIARIPRIRTATKKATSRQSLLIIQTYHESQFTASLYD